MALKSVYEIPPPVFMDATEDLKLKIFSANRAVMRNLGNVVCDCCTTVTELHSSLDWVICQMPVLEPADDVQEIELWKDSNRILSLGVSASRASIAETKNILFRVNFGN